jgi:hypothetical protein
LRVAIRGIGGAARVDAIAENGHVLHRALKARGHGRVGGGEQSEACGGDQREVLELLHD